MPDSFREGEIKGVVVGKIAKAFDSRGWLAELFRSDQVAEEFFPAMAYISATKPGITPAGVVHAYQNVGPGEGIVINCPNRLYRGVDRKEEIDEIRHEADKFTSFLMND